MSSNFELRLPSHLTTSSSKSATEFDNKICHGKWYLIRTSNRYWKDKHNIYTECDPSGADCFFYQTKPGGDMKTMQWYTKALEGETTTFVSQGSGIMRFLGAKWEVIGWSSAHASDGDAQQKAAWMIVYQQSTILTPAAINISCREPNGISMAVFKMIEDWLMNIEAPEFKKALKDMFTISRIIN
ncbi:hypothetical protein GQ44DRAFT_783592 [Phaeosphaeriaceae sp. PMI808]|nr:hypothetical protein GQ44DRAFT_783592 [Phaeosphaeriaceae sp. PMI808]